MLLIKTIFVIIILGRILVGLGSQDSYFINQKSELCDLRGGIYYHLSSFQNCREGWKTELEALQQEQCPKSHLKSPCGEMGSPVPAALLCARCTTNPAILGCWSLRDSDDSVRSGLMESRSLTRFWLKRSLG